MIIMIASLTFSGSSFLVFAGSPKVGLVKFSFQFVLFCVVFVLHFGFLNRQMFEIIYPSHTLYNAFLEGFLFKVFLYLKSVRTPYVKFLFMRFCNKLKITKNRCF